MKVLRLSRARDLEEIVSIVIPTIGREEVLIQTVQSVLSQDIPAAALDLVIVDQMTQRDERTRAFLAELEVKRALRWFRPPEVDFKNANKARNFGLAKARSSGVIILLDDDVRLSPEFVAAHLDCYRDPSVGAVAGRVTIPGGPDAAGRRVGWIGWFGRFHANYASTVRTETMDFIGCNCSFRASLIGTIGCFDERFTALLGMREESDFALRIREAGWKIVFEPRAHLEHLVFPSGGHRGKRFSEAWCDAIYYDHYLFYSKHAPLWRMPFFLLGLWRLTLACFWHAEISRFRLCRVICGAIVRGVRTGRSRSRHESFYSKGQVHFPMF